MKSPYKITVLIILFTSSFITGQIKLKGNSSFRGRDFKYLNVEARTANSKKSYIYTGKTINICTTNSSKIYLYSNPKITLSEFFDKALFT